MPLSTRSFTKQDILTSNRLYLLCLFAHFKNPQRRLFILRSRYWKRRRNNKTSCSSHGSDTAVAGSEFRSPESNPSYLTPIVVYLDGTTRYVLGCVTTTRPSPKTTSTFTFSEAWSAVSIYRTENGLDWEKVKVGELGLLGSVQSTSV